MRKKSLALTLMLAFSCLLGGNLMAYSFSAVNEGQTIYYNISSGNAEVTFETSSYNSYSGVIIIPTTVINPNNDNQYNVTSIGSYAFKDCTGLTSITIPSSISKINSGAFTGCSGLSNIVYNATTCGDPYSAVFADSEAERLTITIGDNVTKLPSYLFYNLTNIQSVTIPASVTSIGTQAFSGCSGLTSITIPASVTSINQQAFQNCTGLKQINYNATSCADFTSSSGKQPFNGCTGVNLIVIGDNVTTVPAYAFFGLTSVKTIIIGSSVTTLKGNVFYNCTGLTEIWSIPTTPPNCDGSYSQFTSIPNTMKLYVPSSSVSSYKSAIRWSTASFINNTTGFTSFTTGDLSSLANPVAIDGDITISSNTAINKPILINSGSITISNGCALTATSENTITNPLAAKLIIEDGGILITHNAVQATVKKTVTSAANWGTSGSYTSDGWYFIASPVNGAAFPTGSVATQDIYQLDWANNKWLNLQNSDNSSLLDAGFQRGTGYLYASKEDYTISVAGEIQPLSVSDNATVTLATTGWNLIGNPLTCKVTVDKAFGELNNASSVTNKAANSTIDPFQGIAVYGTAGDVVTFTKAASQDAVAPSNSNSLQMTLSKEVATRGTISYKVVDNAIVRFEDNGSLPKFSMLESDAKLFIPQNGEEYAIAFSNRQGEMPLNFKAQELGTYTINFDGTDLKNIKLIDKIENLVIDLNENNSYTFIGSPSDRIERFVIRFENSENSESFAYQNGCDIIVSGEGELHIFDVMGRIVAKQYVSGVETINVKANGVYIFRLNGMTQKIVVK